MKKAKSMTVVVLIAVANVFPLSTRAEEGGGGHYVPGANASFIDTLPGKPGLAIANFFNFYDASASVSKQLPFGG